MAAMPSEPIDEAHEWDTLCHWGVRAAWHLSLLWGGLVSLLSWTAGAGADTVIIRGLVTFVVFGLLGWGANAVMVQGGQQEDTGASEADRVRAPDGRTADETVEGPAAMAGAPEAGATATGAPVHPEGQGASATARDSSDASDYLAEAAS